jgi:hypothetical protein
MDYRIRRAKSDLGSTGYIEITAGKSTGTRARDGSLFVLEDAFTVVEGVVARHFPSYDRLAMNDIAKDTGHRIVSEWREIAEWLPVMKPDEARVALNVATWFGASFDDELTTHRAAVVELLRGLADGCDDFYSREEWICVLGT